MACLHGFQVSSLRLEFLSNYIAELSLLDYSCLRFLPSVVAASAVFLAAITLQQPQAVACPWVSKRVRSEGVSE